MIVSDHDLISNAKCGTHPLQFVFSIPAVWAVPSGLMQLKETRSAIGRDLCLASLYVMLVLS